MVASDDGIDLVTSSRSACAPADANGRVGGSALATADVFAGSEQSGSVSLPAPLSIS